MSNSGTLLDSVPLLIKAQGDHSKIVLQKCNFNEEHFALLPLHTCDLDISSNDFKIDFTTLLSRLQFLSNLTILNANRNNIKYKQKHHQELASCNNSNNNNIANNNNNNSNIHVLDFQVSSSASSPSSPSSSTPLISQLRELHLRNNCIEVWPLVIERASQLVTLDLSFNELKELKTSYSGSNSSNNNSNSSNNNSNSNSGSSKKSIASKLFNFFAANVSSASLTGEEFAAAALFPLMLPNLRSLNLSCNHFSTFPTFLLAFQHVTHFNFSHNKVKTIGPSIKQLSKLIELNISGCDLHSIPIELSHLTSLSHLDISENPALEQAQEHVQKNHKKHVQQQSQQLQQYVNTALVAPLQSLHASLKHLYMNKCGLSKLQLHVYIKPEEKASKKNQQQQQHVSNNSNNNNNSSNNKLSLSVLHVSHNQLKELDCSIVEEDLVAAHNELSSLSHLNVSTLKRLVIHHNKLDSLFDPSLFENNNNNNSIDVNPLPVLEHLDAHCNLLSNTSLPHFKVFKHVKFLNLANNNLDHVQGIEECTLLVELHLQENNLRVIPSLKKLVHLQVLQLQGNCLESIHKVLPTSTEYENDVYQVVVVEADANKKEQVAVTSNLRILNVERNRITELSTDVYELKKLKELNIAFNEIQVWPLSHCSVLENIKHLMQQCPHLESLHIEQNSIAFSVLANQSVPVVDAKSVPQAEKCAANDIEDDTEEADADDEMHKEQSKEYMDSCIQEQLPPHFKLTHGFEIPDLIEEGIYLGSLRSLSNSKYLQETLNVSHILNVAKDATPRFTHGEFKHLHLLITEQKSTVLSTYYKQCFQFIEEAKKNNKAIVVHCLAGVSRSASILIAYFMTRDKLTFDEAFKKVQDKRRAIIPNEYFMKQLRKFEQEAKNFK